MAIEFKKKSISHKSGIIMNYYIIFFVRKLSVKRQSNVFGTYFRLKKKEEETQQRITSTNDDLAIDVSCSNLKEQDGTDFDGTHSSMSRTHTEQGPILQREVERHKLDSIRNEIGRIKNSRNLGQFWIYKRNERGKIANLNRKTWP